MDRALKEQVKNLFSEHRAVVVAVAVLALTLTAVFAVKGSQAPYARSLPANNSEIYGNAPVAAFPAYTAADYYMQATGSVQWVYYSIGAPILRSNVGKCTLDEYTGRDDRLLAEGMDLRIDEQASALPEYVSLTIENKSLAGVKFGPDYLVQAKVNDRIWVDLPLYLIHNTPLYWLYAGESMTIDAYLYPEQYAYPAGIYRIVKPLRDPATAKEFYICAEFEVIG
jgi:hypothetical protein